MVRQRYKNAMTHLDSKSLGNQLVRVVAFNLACLAACIFLVLIASLGSVRILENLWDNHRAASVAFAMVAILVVPDLVAVAFARCGLDSLLAARSR